MKRGSGINKRAQDTTIGTLVIVILAIIVLVVLIYGFTVGWGDFFSRITGLGGGKVNVATIVQSCQIACSTQSVYDYCTRTRKVVFDENAQNLDNGNSFSCRVLETKNVGLTACDKIPNCEAVLSNGICSGSIARPPLCNLENNGEQLNCEKITGCVWNKDSKTCDVKQGLECNNFNDKEADCNRFGCVWTPKPSTA